MTKALEVHVGETLDEIGARAIDAWHRMERGEEVSERHVGFENWATMVRVLSPKRLELLRHLHQTPAKNIRSLASSLGRDYRRVYDDVEALEAAGLLDRDKEGVRADYDAFDVQMRVALQNMPSIVAAIEQESVRLIRSSRRHLLPSSLVSLENLHLWLSTQDVFDGAIRFRRYEAMIFSVKTQALTVFIGADVGRIWHA